MNKTSVWRSSRNSSISSATAARQTRPSSNTTVTASRGTHRAHLMSSCSRSPPMRSVPSCGAPHDFAPDCPFGAGSSLEGHVNAIAGGVSVDLSRMNRVLRVSVDDLDVTVEAGVTHRQLNKRSQTQACVSGSIPALTPRLAEWWPPAPPERRPSVMARCGRLCAG